MRIGRTKKTVAVKMTRQEANDLREAMGHYQTWCETSPANVNGLWLYDHLLIGLEKK